MRRLTKINNVYPWPQAPKLQTEDWTVFKGLAFCVAVVAGLMLVLFGAIDDPFGMTEIWWELSPKEAQ